MFLSIPPFFNIYATCLFFFCRIAFQKFKGRYFYFQSIEKLNPHFTKLMQIWKRECMLKKLQIWQHPVFCLKMKIRRGTSSVKVHDEVRVASKAVFWTDECNPSLFFVLEAGCRVWTAATMLVISPAEMVWVLLQKDQFSLCWAYPIWWGHTWKKRHHKESVLRVRLSGRSWCDSSWDLSSPGCSCSWTFPSGLYDGWTRDCSHRIPSVGSDKVHSRRLMREVVQKRSPFRLEAGQWTRFHYL